MERRKTPGPRYKLSSVFKQPFKEVRNIKHAEPESRTVTEETTHRTVVYDDDLRDDSEVAEKCIDIMTECLDMINEYIDQLKKLH
ncbi:hypothetical protein BGZ90_011546 [Linnemannia elongata]|nr:hypothetical protein BGZ90_011546 [Linnemannia elongata]